MIIESTIETEKEQLDDRTLNFLDYIVLLLSQASSVEELDLVMDDFLSDDFMTIMESNKPLFSMLPIIWLDTFERVCFQENENNFSLKILWLPIMFNKLGWKIESQDKINTLHEAALVKSEQSTALYPNLVLLFIEGLIFPSNIALNKFEERAKRLLNTEEDETNVDALISDVISLGWEY